MQWPLADEACARHGATLASIRDLEDMRFIHWILIENKVVRKSQTYIGKSWYFIAVYTHTVLYKYYMVEREIVKHYFPEVSGYEPIAPKLKAEG